MELWIGITFAAAFLQNMRSTLQKYLKGRMATLGSTFTRFGFGLPFAALYFFILTSVLERPVPAINASFLIWAVIGAVGQIGATFLLVYLFSFRNFAVGTAYSRTEPAQAAIIAFLFFGARISVAAIAAIVISIGGVMPTTETISALDYPGARKLFIYVKGEHVQAKPAIREFVNLYAQSWNKGGMLEQRGLVPLGDADKAASDDIAANLTVLDGSGL